MARLLSDKYIREYVEKYNMITNFVEKTKKDGIFSYGLGAFGYDARVSTDAKILLMSDLERQGIPLDPKNPALKALLKPLPEAAGKFTIPANSVAMFSLVEEFNLPENVQAYSHFGKSSYARYGLVPNITPIDAGYSGSITFSLSNPFSVPVVVYPNEGIVQLSFWAEDEDAEESYAVDGKYMGSQGLTESKF